MIIRKHSVSFRHINVCMFSLRWSLPTHTPSSLNLGVKSPLDINVVGIQQVQQSETGSHRTEERYKEPRPFTVIGLWVYRVREYGRRNEGIETATTYHVRWTSVGAEGLK